MKKIKNNIIFIFIKMLILLLIYEVINNIIYPILANSIISGKYGVHFIVELTCIITAVIIVLIFKNSYVFKEKKEKFFPSLKVGAYMMCYSILMLIINALSLEKMPSYYDIISLFLYCISIGVMEEVLFRGWLQNEFIEKYSKNHKQIIIAILCPSILFGIMHISNIWVGGQSVIETTAQIIQAIGAGYLLGCIYYRTKNIWANIFIHGFWDFSIFLGTINNIKECTQNNQSISYSVYMVIVSLVLSIVYILIGTFIIRKQKIKDIVEEKYTEKELKQDKELSEKIIIAAIITFLVLTNLPQPDIEETCYTYESKEISFNEYIYPTYTTYQLETSDNKYKIKLENSTLSIINLLTNESKDIKDNIINYAIIRNQDIYLLVIIGYNEYETDTITYYTYFDRKKLDTEEFINNLPNTLKILETAPTANKIGYIIDNNNNMKYIFIETRQEILTLIEDTLYLLK